MFLNLAISNAFIAVWNLLPLLPTDGYFIFSVLVRRHNIRPNAFRALTSWRQGRQKTNVWFLIYGIASLGLIVWLVIRNVIHLVVLANDSAPAFAASGSMTALFVLVALLRRKRRPTGER
jgi:Zn-dependent protease